MNLILSLSEQESADLERRAAAAGTDVKTFLLHDLDDADEPSSNDIPFDQWRQDFQRWLQQHKTLNGDMDDSRESIYD